MTDIRLAAYGTSTNAGNGDWRHDAACLTEDPELFFPIGNTGPAIKQIDEAKAVCGRCDVAETCLRWALDTNQDAGVWGNLSEDERRALKRREARDRAKGFTRPKIERGPRGGFVPAEPYRAILADAVDRGWSPRQMAEVIGCRDQTCTDLLKLRTESVTEMTADRIDAADLSGPPPVPADTQTAVRC